MPSKETLQRRRGEDNLEAWLPSQQQGNQAVPQHMQQMQDVKGQQSVQHMQGRPMMQQTVLQGGAAMPQTGQAPRGIQQTGQLQPAMMQQRLPGVPHNRVHMLPGIQNVPYPYPYSMGHSHGHPQFAPDPTRQGWPPSTAMDMYNIRAPVQPLPYGIGHQTTPGHDMTYNPLQFGAPIPQAYPHPQQSMPLSMATSAGMSEQMIGNTAATGPGAAALGMQQLKAAHHGHHTMAPTPNAQLPQYSMQPTYDPNTGQYYPQPNLMMHQSRHPGSMNRIHQVSSETAKADDLRQQHLKLEEKADRLVRQLYNCQGVMDVAQDVLATITDANVKRVLEDLKRFRTSEIEYKGASVTQIDVQKLEKAIKTLVQLTSGSSARAQDVMSGKASANVAQTGVTGANQPTKAHGNPVVTDVRSEYDVNRNNGGLQATMPKDAAKQTAVAANRASGAPKSVNTNVQSIKTTPSNLVINNKQSDFNKQVVISMQPKQSGTLSNAPSSTSMALDAARRTTAIVNDPNDAGQHPAQRRRMVSQTLTAPPPDALAALPSRLLSPLPPAPALYYNKPQAPSEHASSSQAVTTKDNTPVSAAQQQSASPQVGSKRKAWIERVYADDQALNCEFRLPAQSATLFNDQQAQLDKLADTLNQQLSDANKRLKPYGLHANIQLPSTDVRFHTITANCTPSGQQPPSMWTAAGGEGDGCAGMIPQDVASVMNNSNSRGEGAGKAGGVPNVGDSSGGSGALPQLVIQVPAEYLTDQRVVAWIEGAQVDSDACCINEEFKALLFGRPENQQTIYDMLHAYCYSCWALESMIECM